MDLNKIIMELDELIEEEKISEKDFINAVDDVMMRRGWGK